MRAGMVMAVAILMSGDARAACAPEQMLKVVVPKSFAAQPKTVYRLGTKYGRVEEVPDRAQRIHGLMVVSEPDVWMMNLMSKTGQHVVDTGTPYHFHAPVLAGPDDPDFLRAFEFGCELDYLKKKSSEPPKPFDLNGRSLKAHMASEGDYMLVLVIDPDTQIPVVAMLYESGKIAVYFKYLVYETGLKPDLGLFSPPAGMKFTEAK